MNPSFLVQTFIDVLIFSYDQESLVASKRSIGVDVGDQKFALFDREDVDLVPAPQIQGYQTLSYPVVGDRDLIDCIFLAERSVV